MIYEKISDENGGTYEEKITPAIIKGDDLKIELKEIDKNIKTLEEEPNEIILENITKFEEIEKLQLKKEKINNILCL